MCFPPRRYVNLYGYKLVGRSKISSIQKTNHRTELASFRAEPARSYICHYNFADLWRFRDRGGGRRQAVRAHKGRKNTHVSDKYSLEVARKEKGKSPLLKCEENCTRIRGRTMALLSFVGRGRGRRFHGLRGGCCSRSSPTIFVVVLFSLLSPSFPSLLITPTPRRDVHCLVNAATLTQLCSGGRR